MKIWYKETCSECGADNWYMMHSIQVLECYKCGCRWALDDSHNIDNKVCEKGKRFPK